MWFVQQASQERVAALVEHLLLLPLPLVQHRLATCASLQPQFPLHILFTICLGKLNVALRICTKEVGLCSNHFMRIVLYMHGQLA